MTDALTVHKLDHAGREVWQYPARVLARNAGSAAASAEKAREAALQGNEVVARMVTSMAEVERLVLLMALDANARKDDDLAFA